MKKFLCLIALLVFASDADAGPRRRARRGGYSEQPVSYTPAPVQVASASNTPVIIAKESANDALDEVNAARAANGLPPFVRDPLLMQAAQSCAAWRADRGIHGHTGNDFNFLPEGASATAAGAEGSGWYVGGGWGTCATYDNYTYAGAGVVERDGMRYMQLFVR